MFCQISGALAREKDAFCQSPTRKIWWICPLAPSECVQKRDAEEARLPKGKDLEGHRVAVW